MRQLAGAECCAFWPLTAGAGTADAPGGRRLLCCINCARAEGGGGSAGALHSEARGLQLLRRRLVVKAADVDLSIRIRTPRLATYARRALRRQNTQWRKLHQRAGGSGAQFRASGPGFNPGGAWRRGERGRPRVQRLHADMAADGVLRLHDELISVDGVLVEGHSAPSRSTTRSQSAGCNVTPRCTATTTLCRHRPRPLPTRRRSPRRPTTAAAAGAAEDGDGGRQRRGRRRGRCSTRRCKGAAAREWRRRRLERGQRIAPVAAGAARSLVSPAPPAAAAP